MDAGGGLDVADLTSERVGEYVAHRRDGGYASYCTRSSIVRSCWTCWPHAGHRWLALRRAPPGSGVDVLLAGYADYLRRERVLVPSTVAAYLLRARRFIDGYGHGADLAGVAAGDVTRAVLREAGTVSVGSTQLFVVALRSFLRYAHLAGVIDADVSGASLPVTGRRRSPLPQGVSAAHAQALLASCDRRTTVGRRDYAVLLVLLRLGLRSCEVASLQLGDIDWRAGEITVHGKNNRTDRLPLPADVGQAIVDYLRRGRPRTDRREVFLRVIAPRVGLQRGGVSLIVRRAGARAGLTPHGAHRLRHALACDMVAAAVPLHEIGQVLRHRDATSTSIYARVDVDQLRTVARAWPLEVTR